MQGRNDPFEQMERFFDQMRRSALGSVQPRSGALPSDRVRSGLAASRTSDVQVTVEENDEDYVVVADLPGFEREEIDLTYDDGVLSITGTHEVSEDEEYHRRDVRESVRIPGEVVVEDVGASYRNGVLEVTLPVAEDGHDQYRIDIE